MRYPTPPLDEAVLREAVKAVEAAVADGAVWPLPRGGLARSAMTEAAAVLGVPRATLHGRLRSAADRGIGWPNGVDPGWAPRQPDTGEARGRRRAARKGEREGFEIASTTVTRDKSGAVIRTSVREKPEAGEDFEIEEGRALGKITTQVGPDGRIEREWVRHSPEDNALAVIDATRAAILAYRGWAKLPPAPETTDADTLVIYPLADLHLGMFAWRAETGEDFDLKIAIDLIRRTFGELIQRAPKARHAVILGLGDLLHADNTENRTMRSGHVLDVDTRYQKVLTAAALLVRQLVEMAAAHHERVSVRILPGNHDEHSAHALALGMAMFFEGHERVQVDQSPEPYWWMRFGVNLIGAHHGHLSRPEAGAGIMASSCARDWGESTWRHMLYGHLHHKQRGGENGGMTWEILQSPSSRDAYNAGRGYWAGRSLGYRAYHAADGPCGENQINIRPSLRKLQDHAA